MIDVDHASIRFPTRTGHVDAVRDASFAVRDGECSASSANRVPASRRRCAR